MLLMLLNSTVVSNCRQRSAQRSRLDWVVIVQPEKRYNVVDIKYYLLSFSPWTSSFICIQIGKSRLLPAVPNPRFDLHFQLDSSPIPRQAGLLFEIRSASKDIVASTRITLQDLLSGKIWSLFTITSCIQDTGIYWSTNNTIHYHQRLPQIKMKCSRGWLWIMELPLKSKLLTAGS